MTDTEDAFVDRLAIDLNRLLEARSKSAVLELEKEIKRAIASAGCKLDLTLAPSVPQNAHEE